MCSAHLAADLNAFTTWATQLFADLQKDKKDPLSELADSLRSKNGIEWRTAVVADSRKEYFRGKDFVTHFKEDDATLQRWVNRGMFLSERL